MSEATVDSFFRRGVERFPDSIFLDCFTASGRRQRTTYGEAARRIAATAAALRHHGVAPGDRIVCYSDDTVELVYVYLACYHLGVVPVPLAPGFSVDMVLGFVRRTRATAVYSDVECVERLNERGIEPLVSASAADTPLPRAHPLPAGAALSTGHALEVLHAEGSRHAATDPYLIIPTSGTTGEPKLTLWNHRPMLQSNQNLNAAVAFPEDGAGGAGAARFLLANSLTHGLAMSNLAWVLYNAGTLCVPSRIESDTPLADVRRLDFAYSFMTPRVMTALRDQWLEDAGGDGGARLLGPGAACVVFAGAPPNAEVARLLLGQGVDVVDLWGSSETGTLAASRRGSWQEGVIGKPFPGIEVDVAANGELLVRADHFMMGYLGDEELTRSVFTEDGFYKTGDAGELTPDGRLRLTGRLKDVFNTFEGSNIYPARIEEIIESIPGVRQVVLIGDRLPFLIALVVISRGAGGEGGPGLLAPERFPRLYERWGRELARVNRRLEFVEKVRRFLLLARPFKETLYRIVTVGKVRRDRAAVHAAHAAAIEALYSGDAPPAVRVPE